MSENVTLCSWCLMPINSDPICMVTSKGCPYIGDMSKCDIKSTPYDPDMEMNISEMYPAISGEGTSAGMVCTIIRTVGCNLRCNFCDSKYSYSGGDKITVKNVVETVLKYGIDTVLFTGGEPLLNQKQSLAFLRAMLHHNIKVFVETNGTVDIAPFKLLATMVMDVKCPSSGMHDKLLVSNFEYIGPFDELKFVIGDYNDYEYTKHIVDTYNLFNKTTSIYVSPIWGDNFTEFVQQLSDWLVKDRSHLKLMIQQHKVIWGAIKRGV